MGTTGKKTPIIIGVAIFIFIVIIIGAVVIFSGNGEEEGGTTESEVTSEDTTVSEDVISAELQDCYNTCDTSGGTGLESCYAYCDASYGQEEDTEEMADENCQIADDFQQIYRNQEVTVIKNPCEVIWLLAKIHEEYTLTTKSGTEIYVTVWRNWDDNVTPGTSFTIRGLDAEDAALDFESSRDDSGILITRYVETESGLTAAKEAVRQVVEDLEY